jgi:hypothetical protein
MAKATLTLPGGVVVTLEGTPQEVHRLLEMYSGQTGTAAAGANLKPKTKQSSKTPPRSTPSSETGPLDLNEIVNFIKDSEEYEAIEKNILDRASTVDRVLLPLYVVHEHQGNRVGLTSGEISTVTTELGVRIAMPNVSTALADSASRYVIGDKVRRKGKSVRYRLSRRGLQYIKSVIRGTGDGK